MLRSTPGIGASRKHEHEAEYSPRPVMSTWILLKPTAEDEVLAAHWRLRTQKSQSRERKGSDKVEIENQYILPAKSFSE